MQSRLGATVLGVIAALSLGGCDGTTPGSGSECLQRSCTVYFKGAGSQLDLSARFGQDAGFRVQKIGDGTATVEVAGEEAVLIVDEPQRVGGLEVTLTVAEGERVRLFVVGD